MTSRGGVGGLLLVVVPYWATVAALVYLSMAGTAGVLVYPLDDTYIHMAMAKNMAVHGVWGVTAEHFTSATSSPLWTGLLALTYSLVGVSDSAPLVWNLVLGTVVIVSVHRLLLRTGLSPRAALFSTLAITFLGTLPTLTVIGMEHTLHVLLTIWFVWQALPSTQAGVPARTWPAAVLAALLTVTRYEGAFAVAVVAVALWVVRRWRAGSIIAAAGAAPLLAYGLWSLSQGGFLLPNSVLLKGVGPAMTAVGLLQLTLFWRAMTSLMANPHLVVLMVSVLALTALRRRGQDAGEHEVLALIFAACTLLHLQFAAVGWFFRYEAYLVVLGLVAVAALVQTVEWSAVPQARRRVVATTTTVLLTGVLAFPLLQRATLAVRQVPAATSNIFEQQYQAGQFLRRFYGQQRVAVNDVGAIGYLSNVTLLDVWGLASPETAALKRRGAFTSAALEQLAVRDAVEIAIIYSSWLGDYGGVPASWHQVGAWRVTNNVVLGDNRLSFFAVGAGARDALIKNLAEYSEQLPVTVVQEGLYRAGQ